MIATTAVAEQTMKNDQTSYSGNGGNGGGDKAFKMIQSILLAFMIGGMGFLGKTTIDNTNEIVKLEVKFDERNSRAASNETVQNDLIRSIAVLHDSVNGLDFRMKSVERYQK